MKNLIILIMMTLCLNVYADDMIGAPDEACSSCQADQNSVSEVIEAITQTDEVVPIDLYYKLLKLGSANLMITHIDGKILSATIEGRISAFGINESVVETITIDQITSGQAIRYYSNTAESPVVTVSATSLAETGGGVNLDVKMKNSVDTIPLNISRRGGSFIASSNGQQINSLRIFLGFNYGESLNRMEIIGGHVTKYKIK